MTEALKLTNQQQRVLDLIHDTPRAANDDPMLIDIYYRTYDGWDDTKSLYDNLCRVTPPDSILRARRKLHELGIVQYTKDAEEARYKKFKKLRESRGDQ